MAKANKKKNYESEKGNQYSDFGHTLRSTGMLLPITEDELKSFNELYGQINEELPDRFKKIDFLFENPQKRRINLTTENFDIYSEEARIAYAARDGQENLPKHILDQMKDLKEKANQKKSKGSKKR